MLKDLDMELGLQVQACLQARDKTVNGPQPGPQTQPAIQVIDFADQTGAGERIRTVDPNLGKVRTIYFLQLSSISPSVPDIHFAGIHWIFGVAMMAALSHPFFEIGTLMVPWYSTARSGMGTHG